MPADPNRVRDLFLAAVELPSNQRPGYLAEVCGEDAGLRAEVERLLIANAAPDSILEPASLATERATIASLPGALGTIDIPARGSATEAFDPESPRAKEEGAEAIGPNTAINSSAQLDPAATDRGSISPSPRVAGVPTGEGIGTVIAGRYSLVELIGEGGMGSVDLASQTEPVKRHVALKLIKTGMDSRSVLARFDAERQALALMDHPNIARIYDGGLTPAGQPFLVMELVRGVPLTEYCDRHRLTVPARLNLFVAVLPGGAARASEGDHPPRLEARECPGHRGRRQPDPQGDRLRRGQGDRPEADRHESRRHRRDRGHTGLHVARAGKPVIVWTSTPGLTCMPWA